MDRVSRGLAVQALYYEEQEAEVIQTLGLSGIVMQD